MLLFVAYRFQYVASRLRVQMVITVIGWQDKAPHHRMCRFIFLCERCVRNKQQLSSGA
jgi:hypothetical protein